MANIMADIMANTETLKRKLSILNRPAAPHIRMPERGVRVCVSLCVNVCVCVSDFVSMLSRIKSNQVIESIGTPSSSVPVTRERSRRHPNTNQRRGSHPHRVVHKATPHLNAPQYQCPRVTPCRVVLQSREALQCRVSPPRL